jgi:hypothetical protein
MGLEETLRVLNEMQADSIIPEYAIGGAVAAFLYIEPATTFDLDVFIAWQRTEGGLLSPQPLYGYLTSRGYGEYEKEAVMIEGWAVQFLPLGTPLIEEALSQAVGIEIKGIPTRVFTVEHLMAICLQTSRPKDLARLVQFLQEGNPDMDRFAEIVKRHSLSEGWSRFQARFLRPL